MTNGTSQGLFIVVAIVIFGIFVGLSYTVFGDTLKPALVSIFKETELVSSTPVEEFNVSDIVSWNGSNHNFNPENNYFIFSSANNFMGGLMFPADYFKLGNTYRLSFDITKLSGNIKGIGGHLFVSDNPIVSIDGQQVTEGWRTNSSIGLENETDWSLGVVYPNDEKTHKVVVTFEVNIEDSIIIEKDPNVYIQPNRNQNIGYKPEALEYEVLIENITLR